MFIASSIREVLIALSISMALVILVILAFLQSLRTTLVPAVTIPVALIGSIALIAAFGFSINVLTLLALLLAIGLVVDDAIVVLENIKRRVDDGETPLVASVRGTRQVTFAVLATSVTLIVVFVPISFLAGQVGRLFSEFGLVMAAAVVISTFVALSLCPMIASRVLKRAARRRQPDTVSGNHSTVARSVFGRAYRRSLDFALAAPLVVIALSLSFVAGAVGLYEKLPRELAPKEDRGVAFVPMTAPQGATIAYTDAQARIVERTLAPQQANGNIDTIYSLVGWGEPPLPRLCRPASGALGRTRGQPGRNRRRTAAHRAPAARRARRRRESGRSGSARQLDAAAHCRGRIGLRTGQAVGGTAARACRGERPADQSGNGFRAEPAPAQPLPRPRARQRSRHQRGGHRRRRFRSCSRRGK